MVNGVAPIVSALAAVALFLSGCGNGGGGTTHTCVNKKIDIKTQSVTGKYKGTAAIEKGMAPVSIEGTVGLKLDMEKINVRDDFTLDKAMDKAMTVNEKSFVSVEKKLVAFSAEATFNGTKYSNCSFVDLSKMAKFPSTAEIKAILDTLVTALGEKMPCSSNDGTYDTFILDQKLANGKFDPPLPFPLPEPVPKDISGEFKENVQSTKDFMLHSSSTTFNVVTPAEKVNGTSIPPLNIQLQFDLTADGGAGKAEPPSDADLDYKSWGSCTEVKPPSTLQEFFQAARSSVLNNVPVARVAVEALKLHLHARKPSLATELVVTAVDMHLRQTSQPESAVVV
jgi:hypothetical protein